MSDTWYIIMYSSREFSNTSASFRNIFSFYHVNNIYTILSLRCYKAVAIFQILRRVLETFLLNVAKFLSQPIILCQLNIPVKNVTMYVVNYLIGKNIWKQRNIIHLFICDSCNFDCLFVGKHSWSSFVTRASLLFKTVQTPRSLLPGSTIGVENHAELVFGMIVLDNHAALIVGTEITAELLPSS